MSDRRGEAPAGVGRERLFGLLAGGASGALGALSFPPVDLSWLAFLALVPLFAHLRATEGRRTGLAFLAFGFVYFSLGLSWLSTVLTVFGPFVLALTLTVLFILPSGWTLGRLVRRGYPLVLAAPLTWVVFEWFRSFVLSGFAWLYLGHTQARWTTYIQAADLLGAYGLTAHIVLVNAAVAEGLRRARRGGIRPALPALATAALLLGAILGYGTWRRGDVETRDGPRVLLVQGNIPQQMKNEAFRLPGVEIDPRKSSAGFILRRHRELTRLGVEMHPSAQVVIWPETMFPLPISDEPDPRARARREWVDRRLREDFADAAGDRFGILGAERVTRAGERRNSAFLVSPEGKIEGRYDKVHAVPGGEYIPLRGLMPRSLLSSVAELIREAAGFVPDLTEGEETVAFPAAGARFAPLICYEICCPELSRAARDEGANVLLNLTNYGWFPGTDQPEQANRIAVFRAVETRLPVVVCANTGRTVIISPRGEIVSTEVTWYPEEAPFRRAGVSGSVRRGEGVLPGDVAGFVYGVVPISDAGSLYAVWGDLPWGVVAAALLVGLFVAFRGRRGEDRTRGRA